MAAGFSSRTLVAYLCPHVFTETRPVLLVAREAGDWQFLCGHDDHGDDDCHVVGVGHLIDRDRSLDELADLPEGFEAARESVGSPWIRMAYSYHG